MESVQGLPLLTDSFFLIKVILLSCKISMPLFDKNLHEKNESILLSALNEIPSLLTFIFFFSLDFSNTRTFLQPFFGLIAYRSNTVLTNL